MRRLPIAVVLLLAMGQIASAQWINISQKVAQLVFAKDITDVAYTYCKLVGQNGDPFAAGNVGRGTIKTTGSSATIDEYVAGSNPFTEVAVGDLLVVQLGPTVYRRAVTARASAAQITVDSAINLPTATAWTWYQQKCGATATDGWVNGSRAYQVNITTIIDTLNATSIDRQLECRLGGLGPTILGTTSMTSAANYSDIIMSGVWDDCRMGLKVSTDTGVQKVTVLYGIQQ